MKGIARRFGHGRDNSLLTPFSIMILLGLVIVTGWVIKPEEVCLEGLQQKGMTDSGISRSQIRSDLVGSLGITGTEVKATHLAW